MNIRLKKFSLFVISWVALSVTLIHCSNTPCKIEERPPQTVQGIEKTMTSDKDLTKRIRIFKPDGSLQCGQGKKIELSMMAKELENIQIFSLENKHDGLMRIQLCGHPTGTSNVFEILEADLEKAEKLGFKKWLHD